MQTAFPRKNQLLWLAGLSLLVGTTFWLPAFLNVTATGAADWQMFQQTWEAARVGLARHHEFPLWNPYWCGGVTLWGNPETQVFYPLFYLTFLFGSTVALKLYLVLHTAIGFSGMYVLARTYYGASALAALMAALLWSCSGTFARDGSVGHVTLLMFYWTPWVMWAWRRALEDMRFAALTAGLLTLVILGGGTYPFPYLVLLLLFDACVRVVQTQQWRKVVLAGSLVAAMTLLAGAIRIVPTAVMLLLFPRTYTQSTEHLTPSELWSIFVSREGAPAMWAEHEFGWWEYDAFVGWTALGLMLSGCAVVLLFRQYRRHAALVVGLALFLVFTAGHFHPLAPWSLISRLPVFASLRVPSRFAVFALFYGALVAAVAVTALQRRTQRAKQRYAGRRLAYYALLLLCGISATELVTANIDKNRTWYGPAISDEAPSAKFFLKIPANFWATFASYPQLNLGTPGCYSEYRWPISQALWLGEKPQVRMLQHDSEVLHWNRSNNSVSAKVSVREPGWLLINQNYAPGWQSNKGFVHQKAGLAAVRLTPGTHHVKLSYRPHDLLWAIALTVVGLTLMLLTARWRPASARLATAEQKPAPK